MLLNDLYTIQSLTESENQIQAIIELKADHAIFRGHFPGQPVLPGVCMMEIITEIAGEYFKKSFRITSAPLIKFLVMIDPRNNPIICLEIKFQTVSEMKQLTGRIFFEHQNFMKFQLHLAAENIPG